MKINLICIGNLKEKYLKKGEEEYKKRLKFFTKFHIIELKESKNKSSVEQIKNDEWESIKKELEKNKGFNILLDVDGKTFSSANFATFFSDIYNYKSSIINFVIGGSDGLPDDKKNSFDLKLSFSKFTFPHQLFRIFFLEQLYRWFMINNNRTYDK